MEKLIDVEDILGCVVSFLPLVEIVRSFSIVSKKINTKVGHLLPFHCRGYLSKVIAASNRGFIPEIRNEFDCLLALKNFSAYPSVPDFDIFSDSNGPRNVKEIFGKGNTINRPFAFVGPRLGSNRVVVANDHFPTVQIPNNHSMCCDYISRTVIRTNLPFPKVQFRSNEISSLQFSCIAYFEIIAHSAVISVPDRENVACICIGLVLPGFAVGSVMPGWTADSFGYHGDDGHIFHDSSTNSIHPRMNGIVDSQFGENDVVGCGLLYPPLGRYQKGGLIFTKNGRLVYERSFLQAGVLANPWFPCAGIDCYNAVEMNFGTDREFSFDVDAYEEQMISLLSKDIDIPRFRTFGIGLEDHLSLSNLGFTMTPSPVHPLVSNVYGNRRGSLNYNYRPHRLSRDIDVEGVPDGSSIFLDNSMRVEVFDFNLQRGEYTDSTRGMTYLSHYEYLESEEDDAFEDDVLDDLDSDDNLMEDEIEEDDDEDDEEEEAKDNYSMRYSEEDLIMDEKDVVDHIESNDEGFEGGICSNQTYDENDADVVDEEDEDEDEDEDQEGDGDDDEDDEEEEEEDEDEDEDEDADEDAEDEDDDEEDDEDDDDEDDDDEDYEIFEDMEYEEIDNDDFQTSESILVQYLISHCYESESATSLFEKVFYAGVISLSDESVCSLMKELLNQDNVPWNIKMVIMTLLRHHARLQSEELVQE